MCASTIDRYGHIYSQEEGGGAAYEGGYSLPWPDDFGEGLSDFQKLGTNTFDFQGTILGICIWIGVWRAFIQLQEAGIEPNHQELANGLVTRKFLFWPRVATPRLVKNGGNAQNITSRLAIMSSANSLPPVISCRNTFCNSWETVLWITIKGK